MNIYLNIISDYDMIYVLQAKEKNIMNEVIEQVQFYSEMVHKVSWEEIQRFNYNYKSKKTMRKRLLVSLFGGEDAATMEQKHPDMIKIYQMIYGKGISFWYPRMYVDEFGDMIGPTFQNPHNLEEIDKVILTEAFSQKTIDLQGAKFDTRLTYQEFIQSEKVQLIIENICGNQSEIINKFFSSQEDFFAISNEKKELYILVIQALLKIMSPPSFDVSKVNNIRKPLEFSMPIPKGSASSVDIIYGYEWYDHSTIKQYSVQTPNFSKAANNILGQEVFEELVEPYETYEEAISEFINDAKATIIGQAGERAVLQELGFFSNQMKILSNIRLEINGQSVESDIILVCATGIFAIEVKNLGSTGSYNIVIEKDGLWKKVMKNGRWKPMGSVSQQNIRHLHGIEQIVNSKMGNSLDNWVSAFSIIAFANDVVNIRNYSDNVVVRAIEIMKEVRNHPHCLNEQQIDQIAEILTKASLPAKKYPIRNWGRDIIQNRLELAEKTAILYPQLKPLLELTLALTSIPLFPISPTDFSFSDRSQIVLEDDEREYQEDNDLLYENE